MGRNQHCIGAKAIAAPTGFGEYGAPAWMKLITTFPLGRYEIALHSTPIRPAAGRNPPQRYDLAVRVLSGGSAMLRQQSAGKTTSILWSASHSANEVKGVRTGHDPDFEVGALEPGQFTVPRHLRSGRSHHRGSPPARLPKRRRFGEHPRLVKVTTIDCISLPQLGGMPNLALARLLCGARQRPEVTHCRRFEIAGESN